MGQLDGVWDVERTGGALPPLGGVRKRIAGDRGVTMAEPLPPLRFDVDGLSLRYKPPLFGLVDELEPADDGYNGRAILFGREVGRFAMRRVEAGDEAATAAHDLDALLAKLVEEALEMEQTIARALDSAIATTDDEEIRSELREHRVETEAHVDALRRRLEAHGASALPSIAGDVSGTLGALVKGAVELARGERAGRNARDLYAAEHMEIAAYEILERIARHAGDEETAELARRHRAQEEAMAARIADRWDRFAELSLREQGLPS